VVASVNIGSCLVLLTGLVGLLTKTVGYERLILLGMQGICECEGRISADLLQNEKLIIIHHHFIIEGVKVFKVFRIVC